MSKLDELIKTFCPNGVTYKTLGELGSFYGGLTGKSKKDFDNGNAKYITYMNIYLNAEVKTELAESVIVGADERQNKVQYGDVLFTGSSESKEECAIASVMTELTEEAFYLNSFCFGFRMTDSQILLPAFSKYLFRCGMLRKQLQNTASGVTRFNVSKEKMANVRVPLPPLEVQEEIVRILDEYHEKNVALISSLSNELALRKEQQEFYRVKLFSQVEDIIDTVEISSIATFTYGYTDVAKDVGDTRFIRITDIDTAGRLKQEDAKYITLSADSERYLLSRGDLVMARTGATFGKVLYFDDENPSVYASFLIKITFDPNVINTKYYWHYTKSQLYWSQANRLVNKAGQQQFNVGAAGKIKVPLISLSKQIQIVKVLDSMDDNYRKLVECAQKEIINRQTQYEYYRDKLLTFEEAT